MTRFPQRRPPVERTEEMEPEMPRHALIQNGCAILGYGDTRAEAWEMFADSDPQIPSWPMVSFTDDPNQNDYPLMEDGEWVYAIHPNGNRRMNHGDLFWASEPEQILEYWLPLMGMKGFNS